MGKRWPAISWSACWVMPPQAILGQTAIVRRAIMASNLRRGVWGGGAVDWDMRAMYAP